jgi:hypothetical protein
MPKDTVGNQKVNVTLASVIEVTEIFNRKLSEVQEGRMATGMSPHGATARAVAFGMAQVIRSLNLPITLPNGY